MPWMVPAAIIGSSLLQSDAANRAAGTQAEASDRSVALQEKM
jgi:hypothetical protein